MIYNMYAIKDDLAGFSVFGDFVNDQIAMRNFQQYCKDPRVPALDLSLYRTASFDSDNGDIVKVKLEFLCRGERIEKD